MLALVFDWMIRILKLCKCLSEDLPKTALVPPTVQVLEFRGSREIFFCHFLGQRVLENKIQLFGRSCKVLGICKFKGKFNDTNGVQKVLTKCEIYRSPEMFWKTVVELH